MSEWTRKKRIKTTGDSANVVVTRYTVARDTAREFKKIAPVYGSQGRALQVATEMLVRMEEPPGSEARKRPSVTGVRMSFRLQERTYRLIRELAQGVYNDDPGQVIAACLKVLKMKRLR